MSTPLGSFHMRAERAEVEAFAAAIRLSDGDGVRLPLTFPMRWLVRPEVRAALMSLLPGGDIIPVHESQSFAYERPLHCDETYVLSLSAERLSNPDRLTVEGVIEDLSGGQCGRIETILRLFPVEGAP